MEYNWERNSLPLPQTRTSTLLMLFDVHKERLTPQE